MKTRCDQLKLDGKYTKILKAFADAYGLKHSVKWSYSSFGIGLEVMVYVQTSQYSSILDVFKKGQIAYVSDMRKYIQNAQEDSVEQLSKQIVDGLYGEDRYIKSMKGGDCFMITKNGLEKVERFQIDCPKTFEEMMMQIDLAGIDWRNIKVKLEKDK